MPIIGRLKGQANTGVAFSDSCYAIENALISMNHINIGKYTELSLRDYCKPDNINSQFTK